MRIALGTAHADYQRLRIRNVRAEADVPDDGAPEATPGTPDGSTNQ